jgi:hypothetical protein
VPAIGNALADVAEKVVVEARAGKLAEADRARQVDAHLLDHGALHLDEAHLQRHLVLAVDRHHVEDGRIVLRIRTCELHDAIGARQVRHRTREDDSAVHRLDLDLGARHVTFDQRAQLVHAGNAVGHGNLEHLHLAARAVEEHHVALARRHAHHGDAAAITRDDVRDLLVGDDDVVDVDIELDHVGLVDRQRQHLGRAAGAETSGTVMRWAGPPLRSDGGCWANAPGAVTARAAARLARTMLRLADMYDLNLPALC